MTENKYSAQELQSMAEQVIADKDANGDRWFHLVMVVSALTGLTPDDVIGRIKLMACINKV